jgi:hypothetical protein
MSRLRGALALGLLASAVAVFGCSKPPPPPPPPPPPVVQAPPPAPPPPPFKVVRMDLGKSVGPDKQVAAAVDTFGAKDTIYLSVVTDGVAPSEVIRAKWTYGPKALPVADGAQTIASLGPKATEFHLSKPSGMPPGHYTVEVFVNDVSAGTKQFTVHK